MKQLRRMTLMSNYKLFNGDCLEIMKQIPNKSIDMVLCDLPCGTTDCSWDSVIPCEELWGGSMKE